MIMSSSEGNCELLFSDGQRWVRESGYGLHGAVSKQQIGFWFCSP